MEFNDKVVLITGAAGGIGKEAARLFHQQGAKLVLIDLNQEALEKTALELDLGDYMICVADVRSEESVESYVQAAIDKYNKIDVFFNNAGVEGKFGKLTETTAETFGTVLDVNVKGVFYGLKHVLKVMEKQNFGNIVNTSSVAGCNGSPGLGAYSASKHAVIGLTKTASVEVAGKGIRVNAICPAPVNTRMMEELDSIKSPDDPGKARRTYEQKIPLRRYAEPAEIAELVLFLCSDKSSYITGGVYEIDGGLTAT
ncbi:SDR family NAD(P)-dependent oxidoreductase [Bacillus timonensis]|uniref:SDR family NAD(P)-dependent oxidoreductase n=1 Tax=Bacillus timonensis TaxID=1033734 RepID=UPI0002881ABF|nr:SDR family NAD(P)-dependent oxidoreductase [Bacillus timonensis]